MSLMEFTHFLHRSQTAPSEHFGAAATSCSAAHFSNIFAATAVSRSAGCAFSPPRLVIRHRQNAAIIPKNSFARKARGFRTPLN